MRVLDVDLDFFLDRIVLDQSSDGPRLNLAEFRPWKADQVRQFLVERCGLSPDSRIRGKFVKHHHEAIYWWRELIRSGELTKPFEVVHVDAHADLGAGMFAFSQQYIAHELLYQPIAQREEPTEGAKAMNAGNYLLVAIACHWLSRLTYVMHP
jgi:hypothetical protein